MRIEITKEAEDRLSEKTWTFYINDRINKLKICLDSYCEYSRKTTRHKYITDKKWDRIDSRNNRLTDEEVLTLMTSAIVKEAKDKIKEYVDNMIVGIKY